MRALPASLLANMPPPSYEVRVPPEQALGYRFAAPLFLALAAVLFGWWAVRSRAVQGGLDRATLLAGAGCLALGYSAWWIWANRDSVIFQPGVADIVAVEMSWLWVQFCMLAFLVSRSYLHAARQWGVQQGQHQLKTSHWRNDVLAFLLAFGTVTPLVLAGQHALFLPFMFACWVLAFVAWGSLGLVSCVVGLLFGSPARVPAQAEPVVHRSEPG